MPRASRAQVEQTRQQILSRALDLASVEGLEGLTIGRLADATNLSKSGLFAHFGSREELQLAVVDAARQLFVREVLEPASGAAPGLEALVELARAWLRYVERGLLRGGCFFAAASLEFDDRPGRVRDLVQGLTRSWTDRLEAAAAEAIEAGQLADDADAAQVAFEIHAFVQEANRAFQLHGDAAAFRRAARAVRHSLQSRATGEGREWLAATGA